MYIVHLPVIFSRSERFGELKKAINEVQEIK